MEEAREELTLVLLTQLVWAWQCLATLTWPLTSIRVSSWGLVR